MGDDSMGQDIDQTPKPQEPSLGEHIKNAESIGEAVAEGGANLATDLRAAKGIVQEAPGASKTIIKALSIGCLSEILFAAFITIVAINIIFPGAGDVADATTIASVEGDVEFWITTYDPAKGGINGRDCGGSMIKVCSDSSSPTGYVGKYNGNVVSNGVIAVPQDSTYHSRGRVDINAIPVPLLHSSKVLEQAKIIIPGYNNSLAVPVGDHFATTITKPNRLDLACRNYCPEMVAYWTANKLKLDSASGLNGGSKVMGKIVGDVLR